MLRLVFFLVVLCFCDSSFADKTYQAENFTITFQLNNNQPEITYMSMKDMKDQYMITFLGIQEYNTNTSKLEGTLMNGQTWTLTSNMTGHMVNWMFTSSAGMNGSFSMMMLMGTVDLKMNQTMPNFPVTKPMLTIQNYQFTDPTAELATTWSLMWNMNNQPGEDNNLVKENTNAINWEQSYIQAVNATDSDDTMITGKAMTAVEMNKAAANKNLGYIIYDNFEGTLTANLDMGFGINDKEPTNGSGWKIIVPVVVVALVGVVAIALLGFCLLRRRGRQRFHRV